MQPHETTIMYIGHKQTVGHNRDWLTSPPSGSSGHSLRESSVDSRHVSSGNINISTAAICLPNNCKTSYGNMDCMLQCWQSLQMAGLAAGLAFDPGALVNAIKSEQSLTYMIGSMSMCLHTSADSHI